MFTAQFWKATAERAIKTFAQALLAILGAGGAKLLDVDFVGGLLAALMAAVISVLTSIVGGATRQAPSWGPEELKPRTKAPAR